MSFHHLAGATTPGAPDEIIDWFNIFQAWITGTVGWTISSGAGTTDLCIYSEGESGAETMLYVHLWRQVPVDRVRFEVRDMQIGGVGEHETTRNALLLSNNNPFDFWISADLDSIAMVWEINTGAHRLISAGLLRPFALQPPDETYRSAVLFDLNNATILRRHDNAWDQDDNLFENGYINLADQDRDDGSLPLGGTYFGGNANIAGEFKHISCQITDPATAVYAALVTGPAGEQTTWIVLRDSANWKFALRTGGVLSTGGDVSPTYVNWTPADYDAFVAGLTTLLTGLGWTALDISGASGNWRDMEYHSTGVSGAEDIYVRLECAALGAFFWFAVADSTFGTPGRHETNQKGTNLRSSEFPADTHIAADRDCFVIAQPEQAFPTRVSGLYCGAVMPSAQGLSSPYMRVLVFGGFGGVWPSGHILEAHDGLWNQAIQSHPQCDGLHARNSQPNNYDAETYLVWPFLIAETADNEIIGTPKFIHTTHGAAIAIGDWIQCGSVFFRVFWEASMFFPWCMRTTETAPVGTIHPGAHLRGYETRLDEGI